MRNANASELIHFNIVENNQTPISRQVFQRIRDLILAGALSAGRKLPSSRLLSKELCVSRSTVEEAYSLLAAEAWIDRKQGAGSFVGERSQTVAQKNFERMDEDQLDPCTTEEALIPEKEFGIITQEIFQDSPIQLFRDGDPMGYLPLRNAIVRYLASERGISCDVHQVMITNGTQHSLDILSRLLLKPADVVAVEDPGYPAAWDAFRQSGAELLPFPVDENGLLIDDDLELAHAKLYSLSATKFQGQNLERRPALVYACPSHQFPLGVEMSSSRRLALLSFANRRDALVIEDDYDCEFRFGKPLAKPLFALDPHQSVFYLGTFNKVFFNTLRLGYLILPSRFAPRAAVFRQKTDTMSPVPLQAMLSRFMDRGGFAAHLRKARATFRKIHDDLSEELGRLGSRIRIISSKSGGFNLTIAFDKNIDDKELSHSDICRRISARPLSSYALVNKTWSGLVVGFGRLDGPRIKTFVDFLATKLP